MEETVGSYKIIKLCENVDDEYFPSTSWLLEEDLPYKYSPSTSTSKSDISPVKKVKNIRKSDGFKCVVCGDKPTGYHYDVISCNGCKTFFRRTIISGREFKCAKGGECEFTRDFRCACRACRYEKCVKAGMNANGIQWPATVSPSKKKMKVAEVQVEEEPSSESPPKEKLVIGQSLSNIEHLSFAGALKDLVERERRVFEVRTNYSLFSNLRLLDVLNRPCLLSTDDPERLKKRGAYLTSVYSMNPIKYWVVADFHLIVEYAKTFQVFQRLSLDDQFALSAHVGITMMVLAQAYYSVQTECATTTFPDGFVALETIEKKACSNVLKEQQSPRSPWICEMFSHPVQLLRGLNVSELVYSLLRAIVLFSPVDDNLSDEGRKLITEEREKLSDMLSKVLLKEHGQANSTKYVEVHSVIQEFYKLGEKRRAQFVMFDVSQKVKLSPIGRDLYFKIKSHEYS